MPQYQVPGHDSLHNRVSDFGRLINYRTTPAGRNFFVDYLIATTSCSRPGAVNWGNYYFDYILPNYAIPLSYWPQINANRTQIIQPLDFFSQSTGSAYFNIIHPKSGYHLNLNLLSEGMAEITVAPPISDAELAQRRFEPGRAQEAARFIQDLLTSKGLNLQTYPYERFVLACLATQDYGPIAATVNQALDFFTTAYDIPAPDLLFTLYLVDDPATLADVARGIHNATLPATLVGYAYPGDLSVTGIVAEQRLGTILHELVHLFIHTHFAAVPPWLDEGLASLYEECRYDQSSGYFIGLPNDRARILTDMRDEGVVPPSIRELVTMNWEAFNLQGQSGVEANRQQAVHHATARYFLLYLQNANYRLSALYQAFHSLLETTPLKMLQTGMSVSEGGQPVRCLEQQLGASITDINQAFQEFLASGVARPAGAGNPSVPVIQYTIVVPGNLRWIDTGLDLSAGQILICKATGEVIYDKNRGDACGPAGATWTDTRDRQDPLWQDPHSGLIGKFEGFVPFFIGSGNSFRVEHDGRLWLGVNDYWCAGNSGQFTVTIELR